MISREIVMADSQSEYDAIRRRAEKRVVARQEFFQHLGIYVIVNLAFWVLWYAIKQMFQIFDGFLAFPWPVIITFAWGIGIAIHGLETYFKSGMMEARREMAIEREMQREMALRGLSPENSGKRKHERIIRLSDDGELIPADEEDDSEQQWAKRSER
jgi:hypothetical protein